MARLRWSLTAERDLAEIEEYIARDSRLYALAVVDRLLLGAERLETNPLSGRVVREYGRQDLREVIVQNYRMVYLVEGDDVIVVRVVHGARNLRDLLRPRPEAGT